MFELQGRCTTAKVFSDNVENEAVSQIIDLLNQPFMLDSKVRIMPDVHAGKGCTIGTTMTIKDKVVANLVGVDIGCGMICIQLQEKILDLHALDLIIGVEVPSGFETRRHAHKFAKQIDLKQLRCYKAISPDRSVLSVGSLGGGNHFIELNQDDVGALYLVVHSGSRNLGSRAAQYYQDLAFKTLNSKKFEAEQLIIKLKKEGRQTEIGAALEGIKKEKIRKELAYLEGKNFDDYIHDMKLIQQYATLNREAMVDSIINAMNKSGCSMTVVDKFTTIHNYIDTDTMILRKGAISAKAKEKVLIPMNMRDGSLICEGLGNEDWNCSAPHGAGRLMSRSKAKQVIKLEDFQATMNGIYSSTVNRSTLDEAPMAYKPMDEIVENIKETVVILKRIKPLYNFKAAE